MTRSPFKIVVAALLAVALAACGATATPAPTQAPEPTQAPTAAPEAVQFPVTLTDSLGREVTVEAAPQRIVSLAPSNTEMLFAIGAGRLLVGRDEFSDYPAEAADVPSIGSLYPQVNSEAIVALKPDLVLAAGITNADDVTALADLGLTVFRTSTAATLDDIYQDVRHVGQLTGQTAEAEALAADMQARVEAVSQVTGNLAERPRVFYEIDATDPGTPWTAGPGSFIDQIIALAGGSNVGSVGNDLYFQISLEELVAQDPEIIVLGSATYGGQTPEIVAARVGWEGISAIKSGQVYAFDDNLVSRPGPRVVEGVEQLARLIQPDLFQ